MIADGDYYARIVESVMDGLEALDVTGYRWDTSDGWTQAGAEKDVADTPIHLRAWFGLGQAGKWARFEIQHTAILSFAARYQHDQDALCQGRAHAACRHAADFLGGWGLPTGERLLPTGWNVEQTPNDFLRCSVTCILTIPRGR